MLHEIVNSLVVVQVLLESCDFVRMVQFTGNRSTVQHIKHEQELGLRHYSGVIPGICYFNRYMGSNVVAGIPQNYVGTKLKTCGGAIHADPCENRLPRETPPVRQYATKRSMDMRVSVTSCYTVQQILFLHLLYSDSRKPVPNSVQSWYDHEICQLHPRTVIGPIIGRK